MIKVTNAIKVDMKERQYEILKDYFTKYKDGKSNGKWFEHNQFLKEMYKALPEDIKRFKELALLDEKRAEFEMEGIPMPEVIKVGSETRSLEEIAYLYERGYKSCYDKPLAKEFANMYKEMVEYYTNLNK